MSLYSSVDPIIGLLITVAILGIVWQSARAVLRRMLDGVEPEILDEIVHAAGHVVGIAKLTETRAGWVGHRLHVDLTVALDDGITVAGASRIADDIREELSEHLPALERATVQLPRNLRPSPDRQGRRI